MLVFIYKAYSFNTIVIYPPTSRPDHIDWLGGLDVDTKIFTALDQKHLGWSKQLLFPECFSAFAFWVS